jgi:hypothetical protein
MIKGAPQPSAKNHFIVTSSRTKTTTRARWRCKPSQKHPHVVLLTLSNVQRGEGLDTITAKDENKVVDSSVVA